MPRFAVRRRIRRWRTRRAAGSRAGRPDSRRPAKVRALIACADPELADRLAGALAGSRVETVGVVATRAAAARDAAALKPDVAVFDADLGGGMRGIDGGLALRSSGSIPSLVVLCPHSDVQRLTGAPAGMGSEWSCLLTETAVQPGRLAYAVQCAAWSVPVVDPKIGQPRPAAAGRKAKRRTAAGVSDSYQSGWNRAVQTFSLSRAGAPPAALPQVRRTDRYPGAPSA